MFLRTRSGRRLFLKLTKEGIIIDLVLFWIVFELFFLQLTVVLVIPLAVGIAIGILWVVCTALEKLKNAWIERAPYDDDPKP